MYSSRTAASLASEGQNIPVVIDLDSPLLDGNFLTFTAICPVWLIDMNRHADITFEAVPSDYAVLKVCARGGSGADVAAHEWLRSHTNPEASGGDTLWASGYEVYSRLSPTFEAYLEGLEALHEASFFKDAAKAYGIELREGERGSPLNKGDALSAVHPVIRVSEWTLI